MRPAFKSRLPAWLWKPRDYVNNATLTLRSGVNDTPLRSPEWSRVHVRQNNTNNRLWGHAYPSPLFGFSCSSAPVNAVRRWKRCCKRLGLAPGEVWRISCPYRWSHHPPHRPHFFHPVCFVFCSGPLVGGGTMSTRTSRTWRKSSASGVSIWRRN